MTWFEHACPEPAATRAIMIGPSWALAEVTARLEALPRSVQEVGRLPLDPSTETDAGALTAALARVVRAAEPDVAIVSMPIASVGLLARIRAALRHLGIPERFFPTSADLLDGVGSGALREVDPATLLDRPARPLDHGRIEMLLRGRRVLVTGAGGSIGSELSRTIATYDPACLVLMDRCEHALFQIDREIARRHPDLPRHASLQDVAESAGTHRLFERTRPEVILHAAAHKHVPLSEDHPCEAVRNNLFGSLNVANAAIASGASHLVVVSTDKAVTPSSVMGATKRLAEVAVQRAAADSALRLAVVRFGNVLGSSGSVLDVWGRELREGGPITVTDRRMTRYLMTIPEAAGLVLQSATFVGPTTPAGRIHVLDMGEPVRIIDLARRFVAAHGSTLVEREARTGSGEVGVEFTTPRPGEKLHEVLVHPDGRLGSTPHPAIRTWDGAIPSKARFDRLAGEVDVPPEMPAKHAAGVIHQAVRGLDADLAVPSAPGSRGTSLEVYPTAFPARSAG